LIEGVKLLEVPRFEDERGMLIQVFEENENLPKIRRMYIVKNWNKNTVRAFHKNYAETKCFFVISGAVKFILVDDRPNSPTYRQEAQFVLTADNPKILVVPAEVHNGWKALTSDALLLGTADTLMPEHKDARVPEESFGAKW
jgi:dTDP-4-dehydrorhamnose 3,5-epimerase-like enzyme